MFSDDIANLNFNHLRYFCIIATEGSIKKAAQKLKISQPALSGQLRQLEEFFGFYLFDRKVRKLVLNVAGKLVLEYATNIFSNADEMLKSVKNFDFIQLQVIRVGVLPSLSKSNIHELILPLWKNENISVVVMEKDLNELVSNLELGNLDIILSDRSVMKTGTLFDNKKLKPRKMVAVGGRKFCSLRKDFPKSLDGTPFLHLTKHSQLRADIDHFFESQDITPKVVGEADDVALLRIAAENNVGVTILPYITVTEALKAKKIIHIGKVEDISSDVWTILNKKSEHFTYLTKVVKSFQNKLSN